MDFEADSFSMNKINEFQNITGATEETAQRFLQQTSDNLEEALMLFFESPEANAHVEPIPPAAPQTFYAGGDRSGIELEAPPSNRRSLIDNILQKAAEGGNAADVAHGEDVARRVLTIYKNGFRIDDGALLSLDDPKNAEFMKAIYSGRAPLSFLNVKPGQPVDLQVMDKRGEVFVPEKPQLKPFSGSGNRLGSLVPGGSPVVQETKVKVAQADAEPIIDETKPTTLLQIRLYDGKRVVAKFNTTQTIGQVAEFVGVRSGISSFTLHTTFPKKDLTNEAKTIEEENLLNAAIVQKKV